MTPPSITYLFDGWVGQLVWYGSLVLFATYIAWAVWDWWKGR